MPHNQFPSTQRRKAWGRITILFALIALALATRPVRRVFRPLVEPRPGWLLR